ncbi:MAG TPA: hypothetical protein VFV31_15640 [Chitinophagaceae bacterium]|nr:hypothetical protein [Chitinophagaceae bacterium]
MSTTKSTTDNSRIEIKPYSLTELAHIYGVTVRTIKKWIAPFEKETGEKIGRYYNALQVKIIFEKLGVPGVAGD